MYDVFRNSPFSHSTLLGIGPLILVEACYAAAAHSLSQHERGTIRNILWPPIGSGKSRCVEFIESKYKSIKSKLALEMRGITHTKGGQ